MAEEKNFIYVEGYANYCSTKKPSTSGKFPSNCYEVGLIIEGKTPKQLSKFVKKNDDNADTLKVANSKFPIPMYDLNNKRMNDDEIIIPNGTRIKVALDTKHNDKYDKDYLVVKGVMLLEPIEEYSPF